MNMIWNTFSVLVTSLITLLLTPYITKNISIEATGFVSLANNVVAYIDIIVVALNAFATRNIAIAYHNKKIEEANRFYSSVLVANIVLLLFISFISFNMILNLEKILNISEALIMDVKLLFVLVFVTYSVNIFGSIFSIAAFIKNHTSITYRNKGLSSLLYICLIILLIYISKIHLYYMALANSIAAIFNMFLNFFYSKKLIPNIKFNIKNFSLKNVYILIKSGVWNSISNIGVLLNTGLDLLITNKMLTGIVMGQISISKQISSMMTTFTYIIVNSFQPKQLEKYAKNDINGLVYYLLLAMKIGGMLSCVLFSCFLVLGVDFINLWIPNQNTFFIYQLCVIVIFGDIVVSIVTPLYYVFTLTDNLKITCITTVISGMVNFLSMVVLLSITKWGGYIVVGTTCVLNFTTNLIITPLFATKFLHLNKNPFQKIIVRHIFSCIVVSIILKFINSFFYINSWLSFFICGLINLILSIILAIFFETTISDKKKIMNKIKRRKNI